ncbi:MAG: hypothetical protein O2894_09975 [Planctomycetota bacterium]|nr:hypothetical protein [Planctomycetota bacterium]
MAFRVLCCALLLVLLAPDPRVGLADPATLDEATARRLLDEAATVSPAYARTLIALGPPGAAAVLDTPGADVPLTAAVIALAATNRLRPDDLSWHKHATPATFVSALLAPESGHCSILRSDLTRAYTSQADGDTAEGTLAFEIPDVLQGQVRWRARRTDDGAWTITEFLLEHTGLRVARRGPRWVVDEITPPSRINPRRGTQLTLPRLSIVGQEPPHGMEVLVSVTSSGHIYIGADERPSSMAQLAARMRERADADPALREVDGGSRLALLLDADVTTPWNVVQWIMQTCAHPAVRIYRIYFGARAARDGVEGALATRLPKDRSGPVGPREPGHTFRVKAFHRAGETSDPLALYAKLRSVPLEVRQRGRWEIVAPPPYGGAVPYGYILETLDVLLAAGATNVVFEGAAMPPQDDGLFTDADALAAHLTALKARPGVPFLKLGADRIEADAATYPLPDVGRVERVVGAPRYDEDADERFEIELELEEQEDVPLEEPLRILTEAQRAAERSLDHALRWLAAHQRPDGAWEADTFHEWCDRQPAAAGATKPDGSGKALYTVGVTGLALSAFLAAGYTNRGHHPFAQVVSRGLRYLKSVQDAEGCFGPRSSQQYVYNHAAAADAMVEAFRLTESPIFKGSAQRALDFIELARNPYFAWRYGIKPGDNDTSVSCWMMWPLLRAGLVSRTAEAAGRTPPLKVPADAAAGLQAWLEKVTDPDSGAVGYVQRGTGPARVQEKQAAFPADRSEALTAAALAFRLAVGVDPAKTAGMQVGFARLAARLPRWEAKTGDIDMMYWLWGTRAAFAQGGGLATAWDAALTTALGASQRKDTTPCGFFGSWDPIGVWGDEGGRVYATAILALCQAERLRLQPASK